MQASSEIRVMNLLEGLTHDVAGLTHDVATLVQRTFTIERQDRESDSVRKKRISQLRKRQKEEGKLGEVHRDPVRGHEILRKAVGERDVLLRLALGLFRDAAADSTKQSGITTYTNRAGGICKPDTVHGPGGNTRVLITASDAQYQAIVGRKNAEEMLCVLDVGYLSHDVRARLERLELECMLATGHMTRPVEFEFIMTPPGFKGQDWHLDSNGLDGRMFAAVTGTLNVDSPDANRQGTRFMDYPPMAALTSDALTVALPESGKWKNHAYKQDSLSVDDISYFNTCHVHAGPPNPHGGDRRYGFFMAWPATEATIGHFSDDEVIFSNSEFLPK